MVRSSQNHRAVLALALAAALAGAIGCARQPDRLWYKPGQPYTMAEFERDRAACTREGKLNFECMRARGWIDVSGRRPAAKEPASPTPPAGPTY
ncbi:MAG: hypothetical protein ACE5JD_16030 [Candidatus Methylomirabilia bacterium]